MLTRRLYALEDARNTGTAFRAAAVAMEETMGRSETAVPSVRSGQAAAIVLIALLMASLIGARTTSADGLISAGDDPFVTHGFAINLAHNPIPADFFDPGSVPFTGRIEFIGDPLNPSGPLANTDTIIRRLNDADPQCADSYRDRRVESAEPGAD
jgi:hypothetical protein